MEGFLSEEATTLDLGAIDRDFGAALFVRLEDDVLAAAEEVERVVDVLAVLQRAGLSALGDGCGLLIRRNVEEAVGFFFEDVLLGQLEAAHARVLENAEHIVEVESGCSDRLRLELGDDVHGKDGARDSGCVDEDVDARELDGARDDLQILEAVLFETSLKRSGEEM